MKLSKLAHSLYIHTRAIWIRYSDAFERGRAHRLLRKQGRNLRIEIKAEDVGLFAQLFWCLVIWRHCENHGLNVSIRMLSSNYSVRGEDWLRRLTGDAEGSENSNGPWIRIKRYEHLPFSSKTKPWTFIEASGYVHKYISKNSLLNAQVSDYVENNFTKGRTMSVHYRGTDKVIEAEKISEDEFIERIKREAADRDISTLFVASDESSFIEKLRDQMDKSVRILFRDHERSNNGTPVHQKRERGEANDHLMEEAMIDSLLLSRASVLIKTPSMLSGWAKVYNPRLPVILVGNLMPQARFFPDNLLVEGFNP